MVEEICSMCLGVPPQYFASQLIETYAATSPLFSVPRLPVSCLIRPQPFHHPINNVIKNSGNICTKTQLILNFLLVLQTVLSVIFFFSVGMCVLVNVNARKVGTVNVDPLPFRTWGKGEGENGVHAFGGALLGRTHF